MNYLLHIIIRVRFVRTCAQNNNYNNKEKNKKKVLACVLMTRSTLYKKKNLSIYLEVSDFLLIFAGRKVFNCYERRNQRHRTT